MASSVHHPPTNPSHLSPTTRSLPAKRPTSSRTLIWFLGQSNARASLNTAHLLYFPTQITPQVSCQHCFHHLLLHPSYLIILSLFGFSSFRLGSLLSSPWIVDNCCHACLGTNVTNCSKKVGSKQHPFFDCDALLPRQPPAR